MSAHLCPPKKTPGHADLAGARRATGDRTQHQILTATCKDRKRQYRDERQNIAHRFSGLKLAVLLGHKDPLTWGPKLLGWAFTRVQPHGAGAWHVQPVWSTVAVRVGLDADVREWLAVRPDDDLGTWHARVRRHLAELAAEQGVAFGGEVVS